MSKDEKLARPTICFSRMQQIRFRHSDPAGKVFYPRYFEMINDCIESFFAERLELPFASLHPDNGVPTARIETRFFAPSRIGDLLQFDLACERLGTTSLDLAVLARSGEELRLESRSTLVHVNAQAQPVPWPARQRTLLEGMVAKTR